MTSTLYLDCGYGIAGDMTLSALCDLGVDLEDVKAELKKVVNFDFDLALEKVNEQGITANHLKLKFGNEIFSGHTNNHTHEEHSHVHDKNDHVHDKNHTEHSHIHEDEKVHNHDHLEHTHTHGSVEHTHTHAHEHAHSELMGHHHNHYKDIKKLITDSGLNNHVKEMSLAVFATIAEAEGKIHGVPVEEVAFHEVGATDSIIDIIGNCIAIDLLNVDRIEISPISVGHGKINVQHGLYPVPAPATLQILVGLPLSDFEAEGELVTPTGAALVKTLADACVDHLHGRVINVGYGAGTKKFAHPNVLRAVLLDLDD